jgi:hypothetical protein
MSKNTNLSFLTDYITADITNGRIGINNASPTYSFDVTGIARTSTSTYLATASGNVGIGTTSPYGQLTIQNIISNLGGLNFTNAADAASRRWQIRNDTDVYGDFGIRQTTTQTGETFVNRLYINPSGNVGIGTSSPVTNIQVSGSNGVTDSYGQLFIQTTNSSTADYGGQLSLGGYYLGTSNSTAFGAIAGRKENGTSGSALGYLSFSTQNGTITERMRITSAGQIIASTTSSVSLELNSTDANGGYLSFKRNGNGYGYVGSAYHLVIGGSNNDIALAGLTNIIFSSGASLNERMRITSGGRVLMGGTSDNGLGTLQVWHPTGGAGLFLRNGSDLVLEPASLPNNLAGFYNDYGSIQAFVGGATGAYCNGTTWVNGSDARLKKDINIISLNGLDTVSLLRPVSYKFISDEKQKERIGFIAQEILEILPQVVDDTSGEYLGIDYGSISAILVKAIQELKAEITIISNKIK